MLINLSQKEGYYRVFVGAGLIAVGTHVFWFMLIPMGLMLVQTGLTHKCPLTHFFHRTTGAALAHRYAAFLPRNNPQPVFIFTADSKLVFANQVAKEVLPAVQQFTDLMSDNIVELITQQSRRQRQLSLESGRVYSLVARGSQQINGVAVYATDITEIVELNLEIIDTQKEVVYAMGEIGETRSKETGDHVRRVAEYSERLALLAGIEKEEAELIKLASPMHDIGKVGIPDAILKKPGKLTDEEFEEMKLHAEIGYNLLKHSSRPILKTAAIIAHQHHEKWNGRGYPQQLAGESIHIYGRITAIADVFDALGSARVYKDAWPLDKIMALFAEQRGVHFDPQLVDLFTNHLDDFLAIREKYPN